MPGDGLNTKDILTLGLASLSLIVTIVWNLLNRRHTDRLAAKVRTEAFALDDWINKRDEVWRTLRALESVADRILALARGAHQKDDLITLLNLEGVNLALAHQSLFKELTRPGSDPAWSQMAYGVRENDETDWDRLNTVLREVGELTDPAAMRERLKDIEEHMNSISGTVGAQIEARNAEHRPDAE